MAGVIFVNALERKRVEEELKAAQATAASGKEWHPSGSSQPGWHEINVPWASSSNSPAWEI
jgi:hypothetical protein